MRSWDSTRGSPDVVGLRERVVGVDIGLVVRFPQLAEPARREPVGAALERCLQGCGRVRRARGLALRTGLQ